MIFPSYLISQHTERFIELTKVLTKTDTKIESIYYGNGNIYFINEYSTYKYGDSITGNYTGKSYVYYRNGHIANETTQDDYGNYLLVKIYDRKGNLTQERITTEIDNRADNISDYLRNETYGDFKKIINYYKYSRKLKRWYKHKVEYLTLKKRQFTSIKEFLSPTGEIYKTKKREYGE